MGYNVLRTADLVNRIVSDYVQHPGGLNTGIPCAIESPGDVKRRSGGCLGLLIFRRVCLHSRWPPRGPVTYEQPLQEDSSAQEQSKGFEDERGTCCNRHKHYLLQKKPGIPLELCPRGDKPRRVCIFPWTTKPTKICWRQKNRKSVAVKDEV